MEDPRRPRPLAKNCRYTNNLLYDASLDSLFIRFYVVPFL